VADVFHEITKLDDASFDSFWLPLYRRAFPPDERVPEDEIRQAATSRDAHLIVGSAAGRPISMARYDVGTDDRGSGFAYLMYMAVDEQAVSQGHGRQMFREVVRRARADAARPSVLVLEVQRPDVADATGPMFQDARRRIAFYRHLGARVLRGVDYVQHVPGQPGVPMFLMHRPLRRKALVHDALAAVIVLFGADVRVLDHGQKSTAPDRC
jgi:ribosomal protein S18 acetylase RimI-like enzyme